MFTYWFESGVFWFAWGAALEPLWFCICFCTDGYQGTYRSEAGASSIWPCCLWKTHAGVLLLGLEFCLYIYSVPIGIQLANLGCYSCCLNANKSWYFFLFFFLFWHDMQKNHPIITPWECVIYNQEETCRLNKSSKKYFDLDFIFFFFVEQLLFKLLESFFSTVKKFLRFFFLRGSNLVFKAVICS